MIINFNEINHHFYMQEALKEAEEAGKRGDTPIGSIIVHNDVIISRGSNRTFTQGNDLAHAEINAMNNCNVFLKQNALNCILYTTVEPCMMCLSTIITANIRNVVFALEDKSLEMKHFIDSNTFINKRLQNYQGGVLSDQSAQILRSYNPHMAAIMINGLEAEPLP